MRVFGLVIVGLIGIMSFGCAAPISKEDDKLPEPKEAEPGPGFGL